jgi:hypothetical protein
VLKGCFYLLPYAKRVPPVLREHGKVDIYLAY